MITIIALYPTVVGAQTPDGIKEVRTVYRSKIWSTISAN